MLVLLLQRALKHHAERKGRASKSRHEKERVGTAMRVRLMGARL